MKFYYFLRKVFYFLHFLCELFLLSRLLYNWKFRSMKISTPHDTPTHLLSNPESYITRTGRFLRKTSLDEIPQLINILKGDGGIIGTSKKCVDFSRGVTG